jgi:uncharacterized protein YjbJ (UPF0337 family)
MARRPDCRRHLPRIVPMAARARDGSVALRADRKGEIMNWEQIAGKWKQLRGTVRAEWGRLTDNDLDVIDGNRDRLAGQLQERYGIAREEAHRRIDRWLNGR